MKTAVYVRVSTEEQAKEGYSIRAQIDKLKDYIRIKDWEFYKVYADEGISGKNIPDRPAINELIADIKAGIVDNILVYKIDRLTRSTRDLIDLTELFNDCHCGFNSLMESIDTQTASGRMFLKIIGIFAEFERENTIERITLACEKKVKEGYTLSSYVSSYGYDREKGELVQKINPEQAKIVREIFEMYAYHNMSYLGIARHLNGRKIKAKLGGSWHTASIRDILTNPNYIGKVRYSTDDKKRYFETEGRHESIIAEELYNEVQKKLSRFSKKSHTKRPREECFFCGTIFCGLCGARLYTNLHYKTSKRGEKKMLCAYRCPNAKKGLCTDVAFSHRVAEEELERYMMNINDMTVSDKLPDVEKNKRDGLNDMLREELENVIVKLDRKVKSVMALYIDEQIDFDEYSQMKKIIAIEKNGCLEQIGNIPVCMANEDLPTREDVITSILENWKLLTNAERYQFMQACIEKITAVGKKGERSNLNSVKIKEVKFYID